MEHEGTWALRPATPARPRAPARGGPYLRTPPSGQTFSLMAVSTLSHSASLGLGMMTRTGGSSSFPFVKTLQGRETRGGQGAASGARGALGGGPGTAERAERAVAGPTPPVGGQRAGSPAAEPDAGATGAPGA